VSQSLNYQPSNSAVHYTPPKRMDLCRTILGTAVGAMIAAAGAGLYVKVLPNLTSVVLLGVAVCVAAMATGVIGVCVVRFGKVRVQRIAVVIGTLLGIVVLAVVWLVWLHDVIHRMGVSAGYWRILSRPNADWEIIRIVNRVGTWSIGGDRVKGITLALAWLGEAALILTGAVTIPLGGVIDDEFVCLFCGAKCRSIGRLPRFSAQQQSELIVAVENREFAALTGFSPPEHEDAPEVTLRLLACFKCGQTNVLTVSRVAWEVREGRATVKTTPLIKELLITQAEVETIKETKAKIAEQREADKDGGTSPPAEAGSPG
jgi:hypothetical protein